MRASGLNKIFQSTLILIATCFVPAPADADPKPRYDELTEIVQTLSGYYALPTAINNHGVVVGGGFGEPDDGQPFLYRNGVMEGLPIVHGLALDINDAGDVLVQGGFDVGYSGILIRAGAPILLHTGSGRQLYPAALNNRGEVVGQGGFFNVVAWSNGVVRPLGSPNSIGTATDINDSGIVVGAAYELTEDLYPINHRAVMFRDDQTIPLGTVPGFAFSYANAINNRGEVIVTAWTEENTARDFLYRRGSFIDLGTLPGATEVRAKAINNLGHVIGYVEDAQNRQRPFLYMDGAMHDLTELIKPAPDFTLLLPKAINDKDQIVAVGYFDSGEPYAFLLTPKKEPKPAHFKPR
jgi:probable HAF family extracellular repeat protein